jgi:hypothetical protein
MAGGMEGRREGWIAGRVHTDRFGAAGTLAPSSSPCIRQQMMSEATAVPRAREDLTGGWRGGGNARVGAKVPEQKTFQYTTVREHMKCGCGCGGSIRAQNWDVLTLGGV